MKLILLGLAILLASGLTGLAADAAGAKKEKKVKASKLRHVVAFKFKETASKEEIEKVVEAFRQLEKQIDQISSFEWGTNVSPEKHDKGFTHQFILGFKSDKARDEYLIHPAHKEFGKLVGPVLADVFVIDFWTKK
jgi:Stress responsive A/B Barrel Domain